MSFSFHVPQILNLHFCLLNKLKDLSESTEEPDSQKWPDSLESPESQDPLDWPESSKSIDSSELPEHPI